MARTAAPDVPLTEVLAGHQTSKGCTSPFAPTWIAEVVRRREGG